MTHTQCDLSKNLQTARNFDTKAKIAYVRIRVASGLCASSAAAQNVMMGVF
jgi:hypothetical protein